MIKLAGPSQTNCLMCTKYFDCKDSQKSVLYSCTRFSTSKTSAKVGKALLKDVLDGHDYDEVSGLFVPEENSKQFDIEKILKKELSSTSMVSSDLRVNDGDFKRAPNFYKFCVSDNYLKQKPYVEQALIGLRVFCEYCTRCSDLEWMNHSHKVNDSLAKLERKVSMLEYGICPNCKVTKTALIKSKELNRYDECALVLGQRCVTADTRILTSDGLMHIAEYAKHRHAGFSNMHLQVHNGKYFEQTSHFYVGRPEPIYSLVSHNGLELRGTKDHPVQLHDSSFKRLSEITSNDIVRIEINQQVFGNKHVARDFILQEMQLRLKDGYPKTFLKKFSTLDDDIYKVLGLWIAEGRRADIFNNDQNVLDFCEKTFRKYVNGHFIKRTDNSISLRKSAGYTFLSILLGYTSTKSLSSGSEHKLIPYIVRTGTKAHQAAFLSGLFEGDGCAMLSEKMYGVIEHMTISKTLNADLSAMLLNFGIYHSVRRRMTWATNGTEKQISKPSYEVLITGNLYLKRFSRQIGFMSERKNSTVAKMFRKYTSGHYNKVPFTFENLNFLKPRLISLLEDVRKNIGAFQIDHFGSTHLVKKTRCMGLSTIFGYGSNFTIGFSIHKLLSSSERAVTKRKLRLICNKLLEFKAYLTDDNALEAQLLLSYTSNNVLFSRVRKCIKTSAIEPTYDFTLPETHKFITNGFVSHNSGKSAWLGMAAAYVTHWLIMLQKPNEIYGLLDANILHISFISLTAAVARDTLWEPYYGHLVESPWFSEYHSFLKHRGTQLGLGEEGLFKLKDTFVLYRHRRITAYPAGPDKRTLRGRTRAFACIPGNTLISTNIGLIRMDSIVPGIRVNVGKINAEVSVHKHTGKKLLWRLKLLSGQELYASKDHKVVVYENGEFKKRKIEELNVSTDKVCYGLGGEFPIQLNLTECIKTTESFCQDVLNSSEDLVLPEFMTSNLASVIGYLVADGNTAKGIHFNCWKHDHFNEFTQVFKIAPFEYDSKKRLVYLSDGHKALVFLRALGIESDSCSRSRTIPWSILQAPKHCVSAFLRILFEFGVKTTSSISYSSTSDTLLLQLQQVLLRLGICSKLVNDDGLCSAINICDPSDVATFYYVVESSSTVEVTTTDNKLDWKIPTSKPDVFASSISYVTETEHYVDVYDMTVDCEEHAYQGNGIQISNSIDELGWFPNEANSSKVKMNANEVYVALQRSLLTVRSAARELARKGFNDIPTGYFLNISSPSSARDKIMELLGKSQGSRKIYGLLLPTWRVNPRIKRSDLDEEFRNDPIAAARDLGCEPPLNSSPFISSQDVVSQCMGQKTNPIKILHRQKKRKDGTATRYASVVKLGFGSKPSVLAIDSGISNNSFACCVAHKDQSGNPRITLLTEIMPLPGIPLNFTLIYQNILSQLITERNIMLMASDRWNSDKILSDAESQFEINVRKYSLRYSDMQTFKTYLQDNLMQYPRSKESVENILVYDQSDYPRCFQDRTVEHFILQLLTVQDTGSGVIKGDNLTDDLVRAAMLAVTMVLDPANDDILNVADAEEKQVFNTASMGVYKGFSSGSRSGRSSAGGGSTFGIIRRRG